MSKKQAIRFAVGTEQDPRSSVWRLWCEKEGDVYLTWRDGGGFMKFSFHKSGKWRLAFTVPQQDGKDRVIYKWLRPAPKLTKLGVPQPGQFFILTEKIFDELKKGNEIKPSEVIYQPDPKIMALGATQGPVITVPARATKNPLPVREAMKLDRTIWVEAPSENQKVCFHIFISSDPAYFKMLESIGKYAKVIGILPTTLNEYVAVIAQTDTLEPDERKLSEYTFNAMKVHLKKGADINNQRRVWVQRYDNNTVKGQPVSIYDIELGKENFTFDPVPAKNL